MLIGATDAPLVIPALNRDGDNLSDLVLPMFGTIAGAESVVLGFDEPGRLAVAMAEAPHGTAPSLQGKNLANPMAMILAVARSSTTGPQPRLPDRLPFDLRVDAGGRRGRFQDARPGWQRRPPSSRTRWCAESGPSSRSGARWAAEIPLADGRESDPPSPSWGFARRGLDAEPDGVVSGSVPVRRQTYACEHMFQRTKQRFEALMALVDEVLADQPPAPGHPHDRTVSLHLQRRGGAVVPREMHCVCPVRPAAQRGRRDRIAR